MRERATRANPPGMIRPSQPDGMVGMRYERDGDSRTVAGEAVAGHVYARSVYRLTSVCYVCCSNSLAS